MQAVDRGPIGNLAAQQTLALDPAWATLHLNLGPATVAPTNPQPFSGGELIESDADYRTRLLGVPRTIWTPEVVLAQVTEVDGVREVLKTAGVRLLDGNSCEIADIGFVGVKGFAGGFGRRMLSSFGEGVIKTFVTEAVSEAMRLENAMRTVRNERAVVVLDYAPIVETVEGEPPEIYPFLGNSRLAETIDRFKVDAVVHGHAHRGAYQGKTPGGASVYNVAYGIEKPTGRPYALIEI